MEPASQEESFRKMRWKGVENVGCLRDDQCVGQIKEKMSDLRHEKESLEKLSTVSTVFIYHMFKIT